jgi:hypothetical protein
MTSPQDLADRLEIRFENRDGAKRASHLWINAEESEAILAALRSASAREVETIEQMARAMCEHEAGFRDTSGLVRWRWDTVNDEVRNYWRGKARAATSVTISPSPTTLAEPEAGGA